MTIRRIYQLLILLDLSLAVVVGLGLYWMGRLHWPCFWRYAVIYAVGYLYGIWRTTKRFKEEHQTTIKPIVHPETLGTTDLSSSVHKRQTYTHDLGKSA